jgi:integrase
VARVGGPDRWIYRWREVDPATGERRQRKQVLGTHGKDIKSEAAAKRAAEAIRTRINAGRPGAQSVLTYGDLWERFRTDPAGGLHSKNVRGGRSLTTIDSYHAYHSTYILPRWKNTPVSQIAPDEIEAWLHGDLDHLAQGSRHAIKLKMAPIFKYGIRKKLITENPTVGVETDSTTRKREPDILTMEECRALFAEITHPEIRMMILLGVTLGLGRSEVRGLRFGDFDLENLTVKLQRGKVGVHETIMKNAMRRISMPITQELADYIKEYRAARVPNEDDHFIVGTDQSKGRQPRWFTSAKMDRYVMPIVEKLGIKVNGRLGWHSFRRAFGSGLVAEDVPLEVARELMRHTDIKTTMAYYVRARKDRKREAIETVNILKSVETTSSHVN